jgi:DNA-binding SARP family transcriptional activator
MPQGTGSRRDRSPIDGALSVRLLGRFRAFWRGREVVVESRPGRALLSLVVLRSRPWTRDAITAEIWPDAGYGPSGRLRQALWLVRKALARAGVDPDDILDIEDDAIGLRPWIAVDSDIAQERVRMQASDQRVDEMLQDMAQSNEPFTPEHYKTVRLMRAS